jgi:hypothetical protein
MELATLAGAAMIPFIANGVPSANKPLPVQGFRSTLCFRKKACETKDLVAPLSTRNNASQLWNNPSKLRDFIAWREHLQLHLFNFIFKLNPFINFNRLNCIN